MMHRLRAYAELLRLSNVLTTVADVWMGMFVTLGGFAKPVVSVCLTAASVCLYLGGMVLNDVLDAPADAEDRPTRPIPSGRVSRMEAARLAFALLAGGVLLAGAASWVSGSPASVIVAFALAATILLYDGPVKKTPQAPFLMGACRALNALLGMSAAGLPIAAAGADPLPSGALGIALSLLVYVMGLTIFARGEASGGNRAKLAVGAAASLLGIAMLGARPLFPLDEPALTPIAPTSPWLLMWVIVALLICRRYVVAMLQPTPRHIQSAVGNAIVGIIYIDAALAWGYAGPFWGLAILALAPPTMLMARFIPQT